MAEKEKVRYETIDIARGIAIILVVIGHYHTPDMPVYLNILHDVIYMFHMPLFLFVSGFLCIATRKPELTYRQFISRKFRRLMIPYLSASVVILLVKLAMQPFMPVDHPVTALDFLRIFYLPSAGYYLWFLWALWWMMCLIPFFTTPKSRIGFLILSLLIFPLNGYAPDIFCIRQTLRFMVYFAAGAVCHDLFTRSARSGFPSGAMLSSIVIFAILAGISFSFPSPGPLIGPIGEIILAFSGISMALSLSNLFMKSASRQAMAATLAVSSASFVIYLFHTTFEGFAKGALSMVHFLDGGDPALRYGLATLIVTLCGTILPMAVDRWLIRPFKTTRFLFGV